MRLQTSHDDEAGFERAREWLLSGFESWLQAERGMEQAAVADVVGDAGIALDWKFNYDDGHLGLWTAGDIAEFLLLWCPRKLSVPQSDCVTIPGNVAAFTDYLAAQGLLAPGSSPGAVLRRAATGAAGEFIAAMGDPAKFGMAKSIFGAALADGADITDADELEAWMTRFNAMSDGERDAILAGAAVGMGGPTARQQTQQLPPVVLPPDEVIEASKAAAPVLAMFAELARFAGAGRRLTQKGNLSLADARVLVGLLGTGDAIDESIGDRSFKTRSSAELPTLQLVFTWAKKAGVLRVRHGKVLATRRGLALASDPAGMFDKAFDSLLAIGPLAARRSPGTWIPWPEVDELIDGIVIHLLVGPYVERGAVPLTDIAKVAADVVLETFEFGLVADEHVAARVSWDISSAVDALQLAGVARRTTLPDVEPGAGHRQAGGNVELTPAGLAAVQQRLAAAGYDAPAAGRFAGASATELLVGTALSEWPTLATEIEAWRQRRTPEQAVAELAEAVREVDDPALQDIALETMAGIGPELAAPHVRQLEADRVARGFALCWLVDQGMLESHALYDPGDLDSFYDVLAQRLMTAQSDGLLEALALVGGEHEQAQLAGELGRSSAPSADALLEAIGTNHPVKVVAKAARKALFRRRSALPRARDRAQSATVT